MFFPFKRIELAWKMSMGYKLKTLSLFLFLTLSFCMLLGGFNLIVSSFNGWFSRQLTFMQPNYYINGFKSLDLDTADFGFKNQSLTEETRERLKKSLSGLRVYDGIYLPGTLAIKDQPAKSRYVLVIGVDFAHAREVFSSIASAYSQEALLRFQSERRILVDKKLASKAGYSEGQDFILLAENYFQNTNGIKVKSTTFRSPLSDFESFEDLGVVWVDLDVLGLVGGMPKDRSWPFFALSGDEVIGPQSFFREVSLQETVEKENASFVTPLTSMQEMRSIFEMMVLIFTLLGLLIVVIVILSTSSNLFINFQNRKADFGLMKAFGFGDRDFFGLVFLENFFTLLLSLGLAILINVVLSAAVGSFMMMDFPCNFDITPFSIVTMIVLVFMINVTSILQPFSYLKRVDPVIIMREE